MGSVVIISLPYIFTSESDGEKKLKGALPIVSKSRVSVFLTRGDGVINTC